MILHLEKEKNDHSRYGANYLIIAFKRTFKCSHHPSSSGSSVYANTIIRGVLLPRHAVRSPEADGRGRTDLDGGYNIKCGRNSTRNLSSLFALRRFANVLEMILHISMCLSVTVTPDGTFQNGPDEY